MRRADIDPATIRDFVLTVLRDAKNSIQLHEIQHGAGTLAVQAKVADQIRSGMEPAPHSRISPKFDDCVSEVVWNLALDRVLIQERPWESTVNPWFHLTDYGKMTLKNEHPSYYDPKGYINHIRAFAPDLDEVIEQYVIEGLNCLKQDLIFAAAVMLGAAAEKAVYLLLEAMQGAETNSAKLKKIEKLLKGRVLPDIFDLIQKQLDHLTKERKAIPYSIHEGAASHLTSLFEMIRVQRNAAVHPIAGKCSRMKVLAMVNSLPSTLEIAYRLINWFGENKI
ncbi:MAG: hypothetical protein JW941_13355 [Candidatus Coatesbacteria bacterium]|nr:hypothetical protein [Candidatus Coatesbacteria bacterium]